MKKYILIAVAVLVALLGGVTLNNFTDNKAFEAPGLVWWGGSPNLGVGTIDCPSGTDPVADQPLDEFTLTSTYGTITGNSTSDTINFEFTPDGQSLTDDYIWVGNASDVAVAVDVSGDVEIASDGATTIQGDAVALGTDTTGNYVGSVAATDGLSVTGAAGEGYTATVGITDGDHGDGTFSGGNFTIDGNAIALATDTTGNYVATVSAGHGISVSGSGSENATVTVTNLLDEVAFPFVYGSAIDDAQGWDIDEAGEFATAFFQIPDGVTAVENLEIWAYSVVTEAEAMHLEISVNGAASNEAYNTHTYTGTNVDSTTTNFAAGDVIYWSITDANVTALTGGDSGVIKITYEGAAGDDCATDARFRCAIFECS